MRKIEMWFYVKSLAGLGNIDLCFRDTVSDAHCPENALIFRLILKFLDHDRGFSKRTINTCIVSTR